MGGIGSWIQSKAIVDMYGENLVSPQDNLRDLIFSVRQKRRNRCYIS